MRVRVESAARLHMGFIDLHGGLGRKFGSIGAGLKKPRLVLEARPADTLQIDGLDCERVESFARCFYAHYAPKLGQPLQAHLRVTEEIPPHVGLGSGTQLALAVATALVQLYNLEVDVPELAAVMGRGRRSGIGVGAFQQGGFLVDGGRAADSEYPSPVIIRRSFPADWLFVVVTPETRPGLSGEIEDRAFADMLRPSAEKAGQISRLLVMKMLPALAEMNIVNFGAALTEIQRLVGDCFTQAQGGRYATDLSAELVAYMLAQGALGAGQSSWGPTVYGLVRGEEAALALEESLRRFPEGQPMTVYHSRVAREGARVVVSS